MGKPGRRNPAAHFPPTLRVGLIETSVICASYRKGSAAANTTLMGMAKTRPATRRLAKSQYGLGSAASGGQGLAESSRKDARRKRRCPGRGLEEQRTSPPALCPQRLGHGPGHQGRQPAPITSEARQVPLRNAADSCQSFACTTARDSNLIGGSIAAVPQRAVPD